MLYTIYKLLMQEAKRGFSSSAVFIARNRFAVLDRGANQIVVKDLRNEVTKKIASPLPTTDAIFYAGTGVLLLRSDEKVALFDVQQRHVLAELATPPVKYVVWSADMERVALLSKHAVVVADKKLGNSATVHETIRIKSAAWDDDGILVYTTLNHIKYCLPNGDHGVVRTLETPVYLTKIHGGTVCCLDREAKPRQIAIDTSEYRFKLALSQRKYDVVIAMIRNGQLCGQAIIAYLQDKGYPEVALHFVRDERIRFNLAVECGNIEVALQSAQELDDRDTWYRLGVEALRQGNHQIVEFSYQKTKNYERLSFLYLITGNLEKLQKMQKIADMRGDVMSTFHNALYLGDVNERVRLLVEAGQPALAYVTAATHGLTEEAAKLAEELGDAVPELPASGGQLFLPPAPIMREDNWPLLTVSKGFFETLAVKDMERAKTGAVAAASAAVEELDLSGVGAGWGDDDLGLGGDEAGGIEGMDEDNMFGEPGEGGSEGEGWDLEDLELPAVDETAAAATGIAASSEVFVAPTEGVPVANRWQSKCQLAAEQAAAGAFDTAMRLLSRQIGVVNFEPLKPYFMELYQGSHAAVPMLPALPSVVVALDRGWDPDAPKQDANSPALLFSLNALEDQLKRAYKAVTEGKFAEGLRLFSAILHVIPLIVVETRKEVDEVKELMTIARDYTIAMLVELKRREVKDDPHRSAELAAYFTHCNLQRVHLALSLRAAMSAFFKLKNYNSCATFARRLLELQPDEKVINKAIQLMFYLFLKI